MSQGGYFLLRARSPQVVATILRDAKRTNWDLLDSTLSLDELIENEPKSRPGVVLSIPDYFPSDADELEVYRRKLLAAIPLAELARLHDDQRGVFVFDPMVVEEHGADSYDDVIAACSEYGGLWFDPARPATEQSLAFEESESIDLTADLIDEIVGGKPVKKPAKKSKPGKKPVKKPAKKSKPGKKPKPAKKPVKKPAKKPAKKSGRKPKPTKKSKRA